MVKRTSYGKHAKLKYNEFPDSSSQNVIMIEVVKKNFTKLLEEEDEEDEVNATGKWYAQSSNKFDNFLRIKFMRL